MRIVWSDIAEADLDELYDYIARDVPFYAEQFVDRLIEAVGVLQDHPQLGRRVPEAGDREDVREVPTLPHHLSRRNQPAFHPDRYP